jgi:antitoxin PrlF
MAKATLTSKGQITIPKEIRDHLGLSAGDRLDFQIAEGGAVLVEPETVDMRSLRSILKPGRKVSLAEMDRAIRRGASGR